MEFFFCKLPEVNKDKVPYTHTKTIIISNKMEQPLENATSFSYFGHINTVKHKHNENRIGKTIFNNVKRI